MSINYGMDVIHCRTRLILIDRSGAKLFDYGNLTHRRFCITSADRTAMSVEYTTNFDLQSSLSPTVLRVTTEMSLNYCR